MDASNDAFALLGLPREYDLDPEALAASFKAQQRLLHPDKFSTSGAREQELSADQASAVNRAYSTLRNPLSRALFMVRGRLRALRGTSSALRPRHSPPAASACSWRARGWTRGRALGVVSRTKCCCWR